MRLLGIVRVGSRCQNPTVERFSLHKVRQWARETRSIPTRIHREKHERLSEKTAAEVELNRCQDMMKASRTGIVSLSLLWDIDTIDARHFHSLSAPYGSATSDVALTEWLGILHTTTKTSNYDMNSGDRKTSIASSRMSHYSADKFKDDDFYEEEEEERR